MRENASAKVIDIRRAESKTFREWEASVREFAAQDGIPTEGVEYLVRWAKRKFLDYKCPPPPRNMPADVREWANKLSEQKMRILMDMVVMRSHQLAVKIG